MTTSASQKAALALEDFSPLKSKKRIDEKARKAERIKI